MRLTPRRRRSDSEHVRAAAPSSPAIAAVDALLLRQRSRAELPREHERRETKAPPPLPAPPLLPPRMLACSEDAADSSGSEVFAARPRRRRAIAPSEADSSTDDAGARRRAVRGGTRKTWAKPRPKAAADSSPGTPAALTLFASSPAEKKKKAKRGSKHEEEAQHRTAVSARAPRKDAAVQTSLTVVREDAAVQAALMRTPPPAKFCGEGLVESAVSSPVHASSALSPPLSARAQRIRDDQSQNARALERLQDQMQRLLTALPLLLSAHAGGRKPAAARALAPERKAHVRATLGLPPASPGLTDPTELYSDAEDSPASDPKRQQQRRRPLRREEKPPASSPLAAPPEPNAAAIRQTYPELSAPEAVAATPATAAVLAAAESVPGAHAEPSRVPRAASSPVATTPPAGEQEKQETTETRRSSRFAAMTPRARAEVESVVQKAVTAGVREALAFARVPKTAAADQHTREPLAAIPPNRTTATRHMR